MKALIFDTNNPTGMLASLGEYFNGVKSCLMKASTIDALPAGLKAEFVAMEGKVNEAIEKIKKPTDQVPAAMQANYALECMAHSIARMQEMFDGAQSMLERVLKEYQPKAQELSALNLKVEKKELVTKEEAEAATEKALKAERDRFALMSARRQELMKLEIVAPEAEEVLEGDAAAWTDRVGVAKARAKELKDLGVTSEVFSATEIGSLVLGPKKDFDAAVKMAKKFKPAGASGEEGERGAETELFAGAAGAGGSGGEGEGKDKKDAPKRRFGFC